MDHLDEIRIDAEDLDEVLEEINRSFGVNLPKDMMHVHTAGDLFKEISKLRPPSGAGDRCDTAMSFFVLRRMLTTLGLAVNATPRSPLSDQGLPPPRRLASIIRRKIGLKTPPLVLSRIGCAAAVAILATGIALAVIFWSFAWLAVWLLILPLLALDPGGWERDWQTLGSLARAVAARNVAHFSENGARSRETDWWRSLSHLIAGIASPTPHGSCDPAQIRPETRFKFD